MMRWGLGYGTTKDGAARRGRARAGWLTTCALTCLLLALAGCGSQVQGSATPTRTPTAGAHGTPTATTTAAPSVTAGPTPVAITDLNTFRSKLAGAVGSGHWSQVLPLLSPGFSFQGPHSGAHLLMPYSGQYLQTSYQNGAPWGLGSDYELSSHSCYWTALPQSQVVGFDGNNGHYLLFGIERWQGYWVAAWAFDDPEDTYCITGD